MPSDKVKLSELIGEHEVERILFDEEETILDVFVIVRSINPAKRDTVGTSYTGTEGFNSDELRLGTLDLIHARIQRCAVDNWIDEDGD